MPDTSGSTPLQYAALRAGNYTQVWETPFSNLHYWEAGSWAKGASPHILRRTGADIYDAISNQTANETQQVRNILCIYLRCMNANFPALPHFLEATRMWVRCGRLIIKIALNIPKQMKPSPEGPFSDCLAVPSTAIKLTWCYTNDDTLMAGLDRGDGPCETRYIGIRGFDFLEIAPNVSCDFLFAW